MLKLSRTLLLIMFCFFALGFGNNQKAIEVEVDKTSVETGEVFTYTIKIEGIFHKPNLDLPDFENFKIVSQSQSKNYRQEKEGLKRIIVLKYFLFAPAAGSFTIDPSVLEDGDRKFKSKSITIKAKGKPLEEKRKIQPYIEKGTNT